MFIITQRIHTRDYVILIYILLVFITILILGKTPQLSSVTCRNPRGIVDYRWKSPVLHGHMVMSCGHKRGVSAS